MALHYRFESVNYPGLFVAVNSGRLRIDNEGNYDDHMDEFRFTSKLLTLPNYVNSSFLSYSHYSVY